MIFKVMVWAIYGRCSVFLGVSHVYRRYTCDETSVCFLLPRKMEGKIFFLPYTVKNLKDTVLTVAEMKHKLQRHRPWEAHL